MNNRDYKDFAINEIYHVYNRGVGKMNIFLDETDYRVFFSRLKENLFPKLIDYSLLPKHAARRKTLPPSSFDLISYCLMPNHFHFLVKQNTDLPITQLVLKVCTGYSKYFNKKYDRVGSVFQDRFKSVRIKKNNQLLWVSYYIHKNPVESGLVRRPEKYKWSSFSEYKNLVSEPICKNKKEIITEQSQQISDQDQDIKSNLISNLDLLIDY